MRLVLPIILRFLEDLNDRKRDTSPREYFQVIADSKSSLNATNSTLAIHTLGQNTS